MALQSRFGTDERFRMDSRFLEEDEDKKEDSGATRISLVSVLFIIVLVSGAAPVQSAVLQSEACRFDGFHLAGCYHSKVKPMRFSSERIKWLFMIQRKTRIWWRMTRLWKMRRRRTCPSCRVSSAAANKPPPARRPSKPRPSGEPQELRFWTTGMSQLEYFIFSRKQVNKINCLFAEMSQRCIMTPAERNMLRLRPKPLKPKKGINRNY